MSSGPTESDGRRRLKLGDELVDPRNGLFRRCAEMLREGRHNDLAALLAPDGEVHRALAETGVLPLAPDLTDEEVLALVTGPQQAASPVLAAGTALVEVARALAGDEPVDDRLRTAARHWRGAEVLLTDRTGAAGTSEASAGEDAPAAAPASLQDAARALPGGPLPPQIERLLPPLDRLADRQAAAFLLLLSLALFGRLVTLKGRIVRMPVLLDRDVRGEHAQLALRAVEGGPPGFHCDPELMCFVTVDEEFRTALETAWRATGTDRTGLCVLWAVTREEAPVDSVRQGSLAAAQAVGLAELRTTLHPVRSRLRPALLRDRYAVTGALGLSGELRALPDGRSIDRKVAAARAAGLSVILPSANRTEGEAARAAHGVRVEFAADLGQASRRIRRFNRNLLAWALAAALAATALFLGARWGSSLLDRNASLSSAEKEQAGRAAQASAAAEREAAVAASRRLASQSRENAPKDQHLAMALAVEAFHAADTSEARAALAAFEGQPTIHRFTGSTGLDGPNDGGIAYGKDRLAITDSLGSVDLNSLAGGADRHFASNASGPVHERFKGVPTDTTALSADGALIAAGHGRSIAVRDTDTGKLRARLGLPESSEKFPTQLRKVRFSPDGHYLALGYDDATAVFRDLSREEGKRNLPGTLLGVFASGTGTASETTVVTREQDKVTWWDAATGSARKRFTLPQASEAAYLALSPDGTRIAYSTSALRTRVWDLVEQRTVLDVADGSSQVRALAFSPDGATLATSGFDPAIRLWDLNSGKNTLTLTGHTGWLFQLVFGPDGTTLASAAADGSTRVWRTTPAERQKTLSWHDKAVLALAYSPDGKTLAAVTDDATFLGDPTAGGTAHTGVDSSPGQGGGLGLGFSADGTTLMTANMTIDLWDLASGKHRSSVDVAGPLHAAAFTPDARRVAVVGETSLVELRNPTSTEPGRTLTGREDDLFIAVAWSRDEATVVAAASNGRVRAWNAATGATRWEAGLEKTRLTAVAVSPDGGTVAAAGEDGRVWILDAGNGKVRAIAEDPARREKLRTVAFSPDSRVIAAAGEDRAVRLWESATGALSETLEGHTDKINAVAFSPDGRILASADDRGRILLTRAASLADPQATVKAICRLGRPGLTQDQWQTYMAGTRQRATCY